MSVLVLMYHRARAGRHGNPPEMLDAHFAHLASHHPIVLPGDALMPGALNVCVSFDDGYFDFYATVFPLLRRHRLKALLAIPPAVIRDDVTEKTDERLAIDNDEAFARPDRGGFCTWTELEEMAASGHVTIAAHGFSHRRLDAANVDLATEIDSPQAILAARFGQPVDSFVFPFGRYSAPSLSRVKQSYHHAFRIGGALNRNWDGRLLYRVDADGMESPRSVLSPGRLTQYRARSWWNRLRFQ